MIKKSFYNRDVLCFYGIENNNKFFPILEKSKPESVLKITGKVVKRANGTENFDLKTIERAEFYFAKIKAKNGDLSQINLFIERFSESDKIQDAYRVIINYYKSEKNIDMEIKTHYEKLFLEENKNISYLSFSFNYKND